MSPPYTSIELKQQLSYLFGLQRRGIKVGLEHTELLLEYAGNPHHTFPSIHLAGTNGKGSTSAAAASILEAAGYKVGLYTSPHLLRFNERIRVNGKPISDKEIVDFMEQHRTAIEEIESTFFETTTAMAFNHFAHNKVDVAVVETGLGGRLDSTNVLKPVVTAITPIALDHREILGRDILSIAREKAGIIKHRVPLVVAPQASEVLTELEEKARFLSAPFIGIKFPEDDKLELATTGTKFFYRDGWYEVPLLGFHQALNAIMALEIVLQFDSSLDSSIIRRGLAELSWPGRLQCLSKKLPIYFDVAHNAQGLRFIRRTIESVFRLQSGAIFVMKGDKEMDLVAEALDGAFDPLIISGSPERGLMTGKSLGADLRSKGLTTPFHVEENFSIAMDLLVKHTKVNNVPGLILGSHYIAEDVFSRFNFSFINGEI